MPDRKAPMIPRDPKGWHSRGYLPHFDSPETVQHVIFRTLNSIPVAVLAEMDGNSARRRTQVDEYLDKALGERPLAGHANASAIENSLKFFDSERYRLLCWCIMPNHVHVLMEQIYPNRLGDIVKSWKMASTRAINSLTGGHGRFWTLDYFDRFMRDERHLAQTLGYIEHNPVKAGLVEKPEDWLFSSARLRLAPDREPPGSPWAYG